MVTPNNGYKKRTPKAGKTKQPKVRAKRPKQSGDNASVPGVTSYKYK